MIKTQLVSMLSTLEKPTFITVFIVYHPKFAVRMTERGRIRFLPKRLLTSFCHSNSKFRVVHTIKTIKVTPRRLSDNRIIEYDITVIKLISDQ
jgi:hypothetical protein